MTISANYTTPDKVPDQNQFTALFKVYYPRLCYFAFKIVKNKAASEDLVQDSFLKLWQQRNTIDWSMDTAPYLYNIVRYTAYHYMRDRKVTVELNNDEGINENSYMLQVIEAETLHEIYLAIQFLPPKCGEIFTALFIEGKKVKDIAKEHHLTESTVRSHKAAALAILKGRVDLATLLLIKIFI